jgi:hypothetical protein
VIYQNLDYQERVAEMQLCANQADIHHSNLFQDENLGYVLSIPISNPAEAQPGYIVFQLTNLVHQWEQRFYSKRMDISIIDGILETCESEIEAFFAQVNTAKGIITETPDPAAFVTKQPEKQPQ